MVYDSNWVNGGNFTVFIETKYGYTLTNFVLSNNRFGRDYRYGPLRVSDNTFNVQIWGNRWDDSGELMSIND